MELVCKFLDIFSWNNARVVEVMNEIDEITSVTLVCILCITSSLSLTPEKLRGHI